MITVASIRNQNIVITNQPIIYYWWFKTSCFNNLFKLLGLEINNQRILKRKFNEEEFGLLYIGKGKNCHDRLVKYHILDSQKFHDNGVQNGRLSSLRQTLCGLLQFPMTKSKEEINNFIDNNCIVEFETCLLQDIDVMEHKKITSNYLPLNYQNTKGILTTPHRKILRDSKKNMRC